MTQSHNRFKLLNAFIFLCSWGVLVAQNPYELSLKKDLAIYSAGSLGQLTAIFITAELDALTLDQINLLDANDISRFDRKVIGFNSYNARLGSDILLNASYAFPFLFLIDKNSREGFLEIGVIGGEAFLLNAAITTLTKVVVKRTRPFAYDPNFPLEKKKKKNARTSFYSGHTSAVAVLSFFSAKVYSDYFPDNKWKPVVWSAAAIIPAATGYFRVKGGKHFPTDVITGYLSGAFIGYILPHIHKKKDKDQRTTLSFTSTGNSVGLTLSW